MMFGLVTQCVATSPQPAGGVSCSSLPRMAGKKPVLGPNRPLSDDLHPECSLITFEMKRNGSVYFQYTHTSADGESKRPQGVLGAAKIRDLTRPPGSSDSAYDELRTTAVATVVAPWLRRKHGDGGAMQAAAAVADDAAEKPTSSSEAPASSPGTLPADDTPMGDTSSETASPNRDSTPVQSAAPAALAQEEPSHDDDDDVAGEADTSTPRLLPLCSLAVGLFRCWRLVVAISSANNTSARVLFACGISVPDLTRQRGP